MYLLAQGAEADTKRTDGATPLWIAAQMGHDHVVSQLLKVGARVDTARHVSTQLLRRLQKSTCVCLGRRYSSVQSFTQRPLGCCRGTFEI